MNNDSNPDEADLPPDEADQPTLPPKVPAATSDNDEAIFSSRPPLQEKDQRKSFGDYELIEEIARGGMGVVYRGRQKSLDRKVAIKMILSGQFASQEEVDRFYTEATAAAKLDHPNIIPVYEVGEIDGHHFFSMKLIDGKDFGQRMHELRSDLSESIRILQKVCLAVHHAHQRGVLHRDLKPGNIMLGEDNEPYVMDLGLARRFNEDSRLTRTGAVIGTPSYMPPEQASGDADITTAADIYSLGAILYEVLAGRPPFQASSPVETLMQVIADQPQKPSSIGIADRGLESICMKCLAKDPVDRYESAADLARDLERWINGEPISVRSTSLAKATKFWLKQNFGSAIWALMIGPVMGIVSALSLWYSTIGMDTSGLLRSYAKMPSAPVPMSFGLGAMPQWSQVPLLILFLLSIVFIGYVTARFVNPKHRGADLAAGSIVGITASLAAFMFAFGPICVLTILQYDDVRSMNQIAMSAEGETPSWILKAFPELEEMDRGMQLKALSGKMEADHFLKVPLGLWLGAVVSLAIYFLPCLFETSVAGPILREKKPWYQALPAYLEVTFPAVTLMTIAALAVTTLLVLGGCGFRWTGRMAILLSLIGLALIAAKMKWHLMPRIAIQVCFLAVVVWFFATDFPSIPGVSDCNGTVSRANRAVQVSPRSFGAQINSVAAQLTYAEMLQRFNRESESIEFLDRAIKKADGVAALANAGMLDDVDDATIRQLQCVCRLRKTSLLLGQGELDEAERQLEQVRSEFPGVPAILEFEQMIQRARSKK